MRLGTVGVVLLLLLSATLPSLQAQGEDEPQVTDPEGDATWFGSGSARDFADDQCGVAGELSGAVCAQAPTMPAEVGRTPAPAVFDIVDVRFADDGENLTVDLGIASLDAAFTLPASNFDRLIYEVCWLFADDPCAPGVNLWAIHRNGTLQLDAWLYRPNPDDECGDCALNVDYQIIPGTPGTIRWTVPRAALPATLTEIVEPRAQSRYGSFVQRDTDTGYRAGSEQTGQREGGLSTTARSDVDATAPGTTFTLAPRLHAADPVRDTVTTWQDADDDAPAGRPDMQILSVDYLEAEKTFTLATRVAQVDDVPSDHHLLANVGTTTGIYVVAGYAAQGGVRTEYSGFCVPECEPYPEAQLRKPAVIEIVAGAPGWINVTFSRSDLGSPGVGDMLNGAYVGLLESDAVQWDARGGARAGWWDSLGGDFLWDVPPFWFRLGEPRQTDERDGVIVEDVLGDVSADVDLLATGTNVAAFDVTGIRAAGSAPGEMFIELGIADLSSVGVPTGYDAVLYAVALQLEEAAVMVGYYQSKDGTNKEFFCAPDTTVLAQPRGDPNQVIWEPIRGLLAIARGRAGAAAGGSTPGSITFVVPYSCLGNRPPGDISAETLAGGAYLMRTGAQTSVSALDEAASEGAVVVPAGVVVVPPVPWYVQPFGVSNFWDITGIVLAVIIALVGLVAVARKRNALKRYLAEIDQILAAHAADARPRETALHALRDRLKRDLLRNRITDGHFVIVEGRIDKLLAGARVETLAQTFDDLPHGLLNLLQDLLADGKMAEDDFAVFDAQLAKTRLTSEAKADVRERARAWVREDAA